MSAKLIEQSELRFLYDVLLSLREEILAMMDQTDWYVPTGNLEEDMDEAIDLVKNLGGFRDET
jgi:hypothetical protein